MLRTVFPTNPSGVAVHLAYLGANAYKHVGKALSSAFGRLEVCPSKQLPQRECLITASTYSLVAEYLLRSR